MNSGIYIVFDLGGTKTRVGVVLEGNTLGETKIFETPPHPEEGMQKLLHTIHKFAGDRPVVGICGGAKGVIHDGTLYRIPHIPEWNGTPLRDYLLREFECPVSLLNDTELVALGEYYFGAAKGERDMVYITVSTGVGGAHIVDGVVDRGKYNAEIGHQIVNGDQLENLVSGTAVAKKYGVTPQYLDDLSARNDLADILARGVYDSVLHWSPEVVVLGGSMIVGKNPIPIERVEQTLTKMVKEYYPESPRVIKATLGDTGGLYGGIACLKSIDV